MGFAKRNIEDGVGILWIITSLLSISASKDGSFDYHKPVINFCFKKMILLIIASLCLLLASKNGSLDCSAPAHYVLMLGNERRPRPGKIGPTFAQQTQNMLHKRQKDIKFFSVPRLCQSHFLSFPALVYGPCH